MLNATSAVDCIDHQHRMKQICTHEKDPHLMSSPPPPTHVTGLPFCFLCSSSTEVQPDGSLLQLLCIKSMVSESTSIIADTLTQVLLAL